MRHAASRKVSTTQHDRQKRHLIAESAPFLRHVGISTDNGTVRPNARDKFRQVQQFVGILDHLVADHDHATPLRIVDLGCGSGVLTLAAHHHLMASGVNVHTIGIDLKGKLMAQLNSTVEQLGWSTIEFVTEAISQWQPKPGAQPDLVIALHACDTATDDAIAQAVAWKSSHLLVAPCCQHDLQRQIDQSHIPPGFESLVRHGIVRERLGDLLTDTFRADVLAALGWRTDVIEFVDNQHTAKNIMIRASQTGELDEPARTCVTTGGGVVGSTSAHTSAGGSISDVTSSARASAPTSPPQRPRMRPPSSMSTMNGNPVTPKASAAMNVERSAS